MTIEPAISFEQGESYFRLLAESIPQMIWTADSDGKIDWVNRQWREYTGLSVEDTAGDGWYKAIHPDELGSTVERWREAWQEGRDYEIVYRWRRRDGVYRWFLGRAQPIRGQAGNIIKWFGTITDVHDSKLEREGLQRSVRERTDEIEGIAMILSEFVESGDFRAASQKLLALAISKTESSYGFIGAVVPGGPQGIILRVFADQGFDWDATVNRDLYEKVMSDYKTKGSIDFPLLDNIFGWPILHGRPIISNDPSHDDRRSGRQPPGHPPLDSFLGVPIHKGDTVVGLFGVANRTGGYTDEQAKSLETLARTASVIYESYKRLQHEQSLLQDRSHTEEQLKQSNQQLLDLAYVVSHELQEPLRTIRSELSLLSVRYSDRLGEDADNFISNSVRAAGIVERMVDDLWEYARIDRPHITFQELDLNDIFNKSVESLSDLIESRRAVITRGELPTLRGEPRQMGMVLRQLLSNAINFNSSSSPKVEITARQLLDEYLFSVTDNGSGFDPTDSAEIFRMFRKLDRETPGSGMGLAIVKRIIQFHGGRIWAESEKSKGARFHFTLPLVAVR